MLVTTSILYFYRRIKLCLKTSSSSSSSNENCCPKCVTFAYCKIERMRATATIDGGGRGNFEGEVLFARANRGVCVVVGLSFGWNWVRFIFVCRGGILSVNTASHRAHVKYVGITITMHACSLCCVFQRADWANSTGYQNSFFFIIGISLATAFDMLRVHKWVIVLVVLALNVYTYSGDATKMCLPRKRPFKITDY